MILSKLSGRSHNSIQPSRPATQRRMTGRPVNVSCPLLSVEENKIIFGMLGCDRYTLATAVVEVLLSQPPAHDRWNYCCTGVVCFVKDYILRSYFFRTYSVTEGLIWEQEFYRGFEYNIRNPLFHCFEASDCMAAFSFTDVNDARRFGNIVVDKIKDKKAKTDRRRAAPRGQGVNRPLDSAQYSNRSPSQDDGLSCYSKAAQVDSSPSSCHRGQKANVNYSEYSAEIDYGKASPDMSASAQRTSLSQRSRQSIHSRDRVLRRRRLSKSEISNPISCTFEHREHIGMDGVRYGSGNGNGLCTESFTPSEDFTQMLHIFQHKFPDLQEYELSEVIEKYGGLEKLRNELKITEIPAVMRTSTPKQSPLTGCQKGCPHHLSENLPRPVAARELPRHRRPAPPPPVELKAARDAPFPPPAQQRRPLGRPTLPPPCPPKAPSPDADEPPPPPPLPAVETKPSFPAHPQTNSTDHLMKQDECNAPDAAPVNPRFKLLDEICNPASRLRLKAVNESKASESDKVKSDSPGKVDLLSSIRLFDRHKLRPADKKSPDKREVVEIWTNETGPSEGTTSTKLDGECNAEGSCSMMDQIKLELERRRRLMFNADANDDGSVSSLSDVETRWSLNRSRSSDDEWTGGAAQMTNSDAYQNTDEGSLTNSINTF